MQNEQTNLIDNPTQEGEGLSKEQQEQLQLQAGRAEQQEQAERDELNKIAEPTPEQKQVEEAQRKASIAFSQAMIVKGLKVGISAGVKTTEGNRIDFPDAIFEDASQSYAELIEQFFPGGLIAFMDRYGVYLSAGVSTYFLYLSVVEIKQAAELAEQKDKATGNNPNPAKPEEKKKAGLFSRKEAA